MSPADHADWDDADPLGGDPDGGSGDTDAPIELDAYAQALAAVWPEGRRFLRDDAKPAGPPPIIALGVSGGSDSRALLELTAALAARRGFRLHVLTVDHGLRPESAVEASAVAARCAALSAPHTTLRWEGEKPSANRAAAARAARYGLMRVWRRAHGASTLAIAHTADDVAETFLLRLARGSGVDGLAEMADRALDEGVEDGPEALSPTAPALWLVRPLLGATRAQLRATCRAYGADWVEDPSNDDLAYDRARARRALAALAPLGLAAPRLVKTAQAMRRARRALEAATDRFFERAASWRAELGWMTIDRAALRAVEPEIALRALSQALKRVAGAGYPPRLEPLQALLSAETTSDFRARTLHGCLLAPLDAERLAIMREPAACAPPVALTPGRPTLWDGRYVVEASETGLAAGALGDAAGEIARGADASGANLLSLSAAWRAAPAAARAASCAVFRAGEVVCGAGLAPLNAQENVFIHRIASRSVDR